MKFKILKRKDFSILQKDDRYCGLCEMRLDRTKSHPQYSDLFWCPNCRQFRWQKSTISYQNIKRNEEWIDLKTAEIIGTSLDFAILQITKQLDSQVIIYTCKECTQEFLKSLIPKG